MPITASAKKALRQSKTRQARNLVYRRKIKSLIKEIRTFISEKKMEDARKALPRISQILDKAAKTNVIKKNTASRLKSRLSIAVFKSPK